MKTFLHIALILLYLAWGGSTPAHARETPSERPFELNELVKYKDYGGTIWWRSSPIKKSKSEFIRLKFDGIANPRGETAFIVLRNRAGIELQRLPLKDALPDTPLVTMRFYTDEVTAYVESPQRPQALALRLAAYFTNPEAEQFLSVNALTLPWFALVDQQATSPATIQGRGVANLFFTADGASCTGFMVAPDRVMTNAHCLEDSPMFNNQAPGCSDIAIQFDYVRASQAPVSVRCRDAVSYPGIDIAVLRVASADVPLLAGRPVARFVKSTNTLPLAVTVVHHPAGLPTQLSLNCNVVDHAAIGANLRHNCNTAPGSSGSPVFDAQGNVVGVQAVGFFETAGVTMTKAAFDIATARGQVFYNTAVDAKRIRSTIKEFDQ